MASKLVGKLLNTNMCKISCKPTNATKTLACMQSTQITQPCHNTNRVEPGDFDVFDYDYKPCQQVVTYCPKFRMNRLTCGCMTCVVKGQK